MIECRRLPGGGIVAAYAVVIEIVLLMIRFGCRGKVALMTGKTSCRGIRVTGCVAAQTGNTGMPARQRKGRLVVIKSSRLPGCRCVTRATVVIKIILLMVRIGRCSKVSRVTRVALRRGIGKPTGMTSHARDRGVRTGKQEPGHGVIESARFGGKPGVR
jgi:hypothetical protein